MSSAWVGIGLTLAVVIAGIIMRFGRDGRRMEDLELGLAELKEHASDQDIHWTPRERDALTRKIEELERLIISQSTLLVDMGRRQYGDK